MKPLSERIKIEQHFAEGGDIEIRHVPDADDQWDVFSPNDRSKAVFHWDIYDYRIHYPKPEGEGWIRWEGGDRPIDYFTDVEFMLRNGWISSDKAGRGNWKHFGIKYDIIWYRVPKMSDLSETRTLWLEREVERLRAENNAMRGYLASMPCPYECDGGLVSVPSSTLNGEYRDEEIDCPHCTKLKELGVNDE